MTVERSSARTMESVQRVCQERRQPCETSGHMGKVGWTAEQVMLRVASEKVLEAALSATARAVSRAGRVCVYLRRQGQCQQHLGRLAVAGNMESSFRASWGSPRLQGQEMESSELPLGSSLLGLGPETTGHRPEGRAGTEDMQASRQRLPLSQVTAWFQSHLLPFSLCDLGTPLAITPCQPHL